MKILFVEDNAGDRDLIQAVLNGEDCEIQFATTFHEALEKKQQFRPDLVVMDMNLPDADPSFMVKNMKQLNSDCAVVVLTGDASAKALLEANNSAADDYILKETLRNGPELMNRLIKAGYNHMTKNSQTSPLSVLAMKRSSIPQAETLLTLQFQNKAMEARNEQVDGKFEHIAVLINGLKDQFTNQFTLLNQSNQDHTNRILSLEEIEQRREKEEEDRKLIREGIWKIPNKLKSYIIILGKISAGILSIVGLFAIVWPFIKVFLFHLPLQP